MCVGGVPRSSEPLTCMILLSDGPLLHITTGALLPAADAREGEASARCAGVLKAAGETASFLCMLVSRQLKAAGEAASFLCMLVNV